MLSNSLDSKNSSSATVADSSAGGGETWLRQDEGDSGLARPAALTKGEPMRIGISTSVIQRGKTGIAQYVFALLRALVSHGSLHQFCLFVLEEDLPLFDFLGRRCELVPVPECFRAPARNIIWHQALLPGLVKSRRLDVLHVPSYRRMLWPRPCPLVATIHDLAPFHLARKYDRKRMFYGRVVARRLARRQDEIIAISENTARDLVQFFALPRERISVVHNGIEHDRFRPGSPGKARAALPATYGLDAPFFLYVARLEHPAKNHVRLISGFEMFKAATGSNWQLVLAGNDWTGAEAVHSAIRQSPCAADIKTPGFVPDELLPDLYRAAAVFVYPSYYEGFGLPPLEAMACGCPVIASTSGSLAEVLGDAAAAIDPGDVHSLARQLFLLATDESLRNQLREAGFAQAKKFCWTRTATETLKVYARAARQPKNTQQLVG